MKFQLLLVIMIFAVATFNSFILVIKHGKSKTAYKFLYASLFFYNLLLGIYLVGFDAGFIVEMPYLLRSLSPLIYLCAPLFYFFIRNSLQGLSGLKKSDWVHFLPAIIHLVDLLPFYLESNEVKSAFALIIVSDNSKLNFEASGWIPIQLHYLLRIFLQSAYFIYSLYLVNKMRPDLLKFSPGQKHIHDISIVLINIGWLVLFQSAYAVLEVLISFEIIDWSRENYYLRRLSLFGLFGLNLFVLFRPEGWIDKSENEKSGQTDMDSITTLIPEVLSKDLILSQEQPEILSLNETLLIKSEIILIMEKEQIFTENGLTLSHFASRIDVSPKLVSLVINREFDKGFKEFVNQYRIAYAITKIETGYLDDYTLEGLGEISGFNSRTTFFNAFKKAMGCSPSEYWRNFQESPS